MKHVLYCAEENTPIERSDVEKGFETGKDEYIVVQEEELKRIAPATATTMDILQFVSRDEVDPPYFESSYYVTPEDKSPKPFAVVAAALRETGPQAIAKVSMHNREHIVLIRPLKSGLALHTLFYTNELHAADNQADAPSAEYSDKELELAKDLVQRLKAPFEPEAFKDAYRENVERLIEEKRQDQPVTGAAPARTAPVINLMEALKRSLEAAPSPKGRQREEATARDAPRATKPRKKGGSQAAPRVEGRGTRERLQITPPLWPPLRRATRSAQRVLPEFGN